MEAPHVVIFPYDEHSHATPAFALGRALASNGVQVTLVLTATRYANLSPTLPSGVDNGRFCVEPLPDDVVDDDQLQDDLCFQHSLQKLKPGLHHLLLHMQPPPSCLLSDILYPWSQALADHLRLPRFIFCAHPAIIFLLGFHAPRLISKGLLPFQPGMEDEVIDFIPGLPKNFRLADVPVDFLQRDHKHLEVVTHIQRSMRSAAGVVINSLYELEPDTMDALSGEGFRMYAVGPMSSLDWTNKHGHVLPYLVADDEGCLRWLDSQPRGAVVYVAIGSIISFTEEEIQEVAFGLEACGQPFLWVLRHQAGGTDPMLSLPVGFHERTKERGRVIGWAPQKAVLAHPSVGCFINQCGMSSVLEALWEGVPMIGGFYKISDQNTIFRMVTKEWGVTMALQDGNVLQQPPPLPLRSSIEACVKELMHGEKGLPVSRNATQLRAVLRKAVEPNGSSYLSLEKLVDALHTHVPNGIIA